MGPSSRNPTSKNGPRALADLLTELMARRGLARIRAASACEAVWSEVAGPMLAEQSRVGTSRGGVLEVVVASSMLAQEVAFQKASLLTELRRRLPDELIKDLRIRVGRIG